MRAGIAQHARHNLRPQADIFAGITDDRRAARRSARGMKSNDFAHRHGKETKGMGVAQILFFGERQAMHILQTLDSGRFDSHRLKFAAIKGHGAVEPLDQFA